MKIVFSEIIRELKAIFSNYLFNSFSSIYNTSHNKYNNTSHASNDTNHNNISHIYDNSRHTIITINYHAE